MDKGINAIGIKKIWTKYVVPVSGEEGDEDRRIGRAKAGVPGLRLAGEGENIRILEDWVEFYAPGMKERSTCVKTINALARLKPHDIGSPNEGIRLGHMVWNMIKPSWEAWLEGQECPVNGTPLSVWPGVTPEQVELFKQYSMRSVEDIANMSDGLITKIPLPGIRDLKVSAGLFLASSGQTQAAEHMKAKEEEIAEMARQMEEMKKIIIEMQDEPKTAKKRGRPRKVALTTDTEAAA